MTKLEFQTLDELREAIAKHKEEGAKIIKHFKKMEEYYSDWEDKLNQIEEAIQEATSIAGINKQEIEAPKDAFEEFF